MTALSNLKNLPRRRLSANRPDFILTECHHLSSRVSAPHNPFASAIIRSASPKENSGHRNRGTTLILTFGSASITFVPIIPPGTILKACLKMTSKDFIKALSPGIGRLGRLQLTLDRARRGNFHPVTIFLAVFGTLMGFYGAKITVRTSMKRAKDGELRPKKEAPWPN